jgi:hypothetical protein
MHRTTIGPLVLALLLTVLTAGCGSSGQDSPAAAPASTAAPTTTATSPTTAAAAATTTPSSAAARCSNGVLLRAAQQVVRQSGSTVAISSITLTRCRNGYALVSAHPASGNLEAPNVFLIWRPAAGTWEALDLGTGIDCAGSPNGPELTQACKALGYPVQG